MELQPNLLAVNSLPPVFAAGNSETESEAVREEAAAEPVTPIINGFFISPLLQFDNQALALIFQVRDSESGEVQRQFPRESVVERLRTNPDALAVRIANGDDEVVTAQSGVSGQEASESTPVAPVVGAGGSDATGASEPEVVGNGGVEVANGAPAVGGTTAGLPSGLAPGSQGVNFLV